MSNVDQAKEIAKTALLIFFAKYKAIILSILALIVLIAGLVGFVLSAVNTMTPVLSQPNGGGCSSRSDIGRFISDANKMPDGPDKWNLITWLQKWATQPTGSGCGTVFNGKLTLPYAKSVAEDGITFQRFGGVSDSWWCHAHRETPSNGIDMTGAGDSVVIAAMDGTVIKAAVEPWGGEVQIKHEGGIISRYAHLNHTFPVIVGDVVKAGQPIGSTYNGPIVSGRVIWSTGAHLHFALTINGVATDPVVFYKDNGVSIYDYMPGPSGGCTVP